MRRRNTAREGVIARKTSSRTRFHARRERNARAIARGAGMLIHVVQKSRPTQNKRARERARQERRQEKEARRADRARQPTRAVSENGEDPDIAGIVPGPQPSPWGDDEEEEETV